MSRLKKEKPQVVVRKDFTPSELNAVKKEVSDFSNESKEKWLVSKKAIRLHTKIGPKGPINEIVVIQSNDGSFIYSGLCLLWDKAKLWNERSKLKTPDVVAEYDKMSQEVSEPGLQLSIDSI